MFPIRKLAVDYSTFNKFVRAMQKYSKMNYTRKEIHELYKNVVWQGMYHTTLRGKGNFMISLLFDKQMSGKYIVPNDWFRAIMYRTGYNKELLEFAYRDQSAKYRASSNKTYVSRVVFFTLLYRIMRKNRDNYMHNDELSKVITKYKISYVSVMKYFDNTVLEWHKFAQLNDFSFRRQYWDNFGLMLKTVR